MGRLLVHLRQIAASTCDRLQLYKHIYFSPNWWHHRVLELCIIGKEAPLMYWSPCCVTRGFKKVTVTLSQPEKTMESVGPTVTLTSSLLLPLCGTLKVNEDSWLAGSQWMYICIRVWRYLSLCVCLSLCVILRGQSSSCGSQRAMLFPSQQEGGHCPYAVFTHTDTCRFTHLKKKTTTQRSVQSHVPAGTYMSSCKYADTCMKNSRTHIIQRMFRSPSVNNWCTVFPAQTHTSCLSFWGDNRPRTGVYFMLLTSNNIKWNPESYANGHNENINIKKTPKTKSN